MLRIGVLVSGGGSNLQAIIDQIEEGNLKNVSINVVISNKKDAYALQRAEKYDIPTKVLLRKDFSSKEEYDLAMFDLINSFNVDIIVLAGCLFILPKIITENYKNKIINIHPSLIPSFCGDGFYGIKVHEEVIKRGVKITGATVHFVDEGTDTGPIILQKAVDVEDDDTPEVLQKRVMEEAEWIILPKAIEMIAQDKIAVREKKVLKK
ncbi:MAG TPA: phosphoribosylglycinamide formyltransferase [Clostridiales bacterium]|nr:phosphoribosylglycinamide formyltransferase [Clostridiales bacterium]